MVSAASEAGELVHYVLHNGRASEIERIARLARLEEHVRILSSPAQDRVIRAERTLSMRSNELLFQQRVDGLVRNNRGLVDLRRRPEAVEEMHERNPRSERRNVRDRRHITRVLHGV